MNNSGRGPRKYIALFMLLCVMVAGCATPSSQSPGKPAEGTAPASPSGTPAASKDDVVRIGTFGGIPSTLSPFDSQGRLQGVIENIYEPLVYPSQGTWELKPVLAESWTTSDDGKVWRFSLRKGVAFHDGTPFTAEAVKLSYEMLMKTKKAMGESLLRNVKEVKVVDDHTIEFVIDPVGVPFLVRLTAFLIVSPKALKEHGNNPDWFTRNTSGTGSYQLEEYKTGDRLVLKRNESWWGPKPYFAKAVYLTVPEASAQALMIEQGELDIAYNIPPQSLQKFEGNQKLKVMNVKGDRVMNVRLNQVHGPLQNKDLRLALAYAVDYEALAKARNLEVAPPDGPVPSQYLGDWRPPNLIVKQDLEKAKEHLAKSGLKDVKLEMYLPAGAAVQITSAEILQASFQKIGVTLKVNQAEFNPIFNRVVRFAKERNPADALDIFTLVRGPFVPHPYAYFNSYEKGETWNFMSYENAEAQALWAKGLAAGSGAEAQTFFRQAVEKIVADQPDLWLYVEKRIVVLSSQIEGYYMHPTWFPETHIWGLSRKK